MNTLHRDEAAIDEYFLKLGEGRPITSSEIFHDRVGFEIIEGHSVTKIIEHFWQAARAASYISSMNRYAQDDNTRDGHKFMTRKLPRVHELFSANKDQMSAEDLERLMGAQVRLQTVPAPAFMDMWKDTALSCIDQLTDVWFKANFDHFTKLGIYPGDAFIEAWWDKTKDRVDSFDAGDQFRILYKMATFDFLRTNDFGDVYQDVPSPCRMIADYVFGIVEPNANRLFRQSINNQVFFAGLWFDKDFVRGFPVAGDRDLVAPSSERKVAESIGATSISVSEYGLRVPVTGHKIDLKLTHQGKTYGCEVDGISHFNFIAGQAAHDSAVIYNASTRFHSWLTAQYLTDINVIRIPYFLFDETNDGLPWEKTLSRMSRKEEYGVYAWHDGSIARNMADKNGFIFPGKTL